MKKILNQFKGPLILLLTAVIWGTTFVAQSLGSDYVGPFTYCGFRFIISGIIMIIYTVIDTSQKKKKGLDASLIINDGYSNKKIYIMAFLVGLGLFIGSVLQQLGLTLTKSPSKSGFISATYMLFVPIFCLIFFKEKVKHYIWILLGVALTGSFLISYDPNSEFLLELGDLATLGGALGFSIQISVIDKVNPHINSTLLSGIEFLIVGLFSIPCMLLFEEFSVDAFVKALPAILYAAILSGCIAYTLQIVGQKYTEPSIAAMLMSLESVFALLSSILFLHEQISLNAWIGSILIFASVILAQLPRFKKKESSS